LSKVRAEWKWSKYGEHWRLVLSSKDWVRQYEGISNWRRLAVIIALEKAVERGEYGANRILELIDVLGSECVIGCK
jgi:hypothetical protein